MHRAGVWQEPSVVGGQIARWVVVVLTLAGALSILSAEATDAVLAILLGGGVFAAALAFGLAGQEMARQTLQRIQNDAREEDRDTISHL